MNWKFWFNNFLEFNLNTDHSLPLEPVEFRSEASTSKEEDFWKFYQPKKEEKVQSRVGLQLNMKFLDSMISPRSSKTKGGKEKMKEKENESEKEKISTIKFSPLSSKSSRVVGGKSLKRKIVEDDCPDSCSKKPKRVLKVRCASKRVTT